jgi:glycosyltransferase involved in cell wall biosynthesis
VTQTTGGIETILLMLFRNFDRSAFEFHLACPPGTSLEGNARACGITVHGIPMVRHADPFRDPLALIRLIQLMRRERYAIVHGHSAKGGYLGRLAARLAGRSKTVYSPQAFSFLSQRGLARHLFRWVERLAVPWTDIVVAASESEKARAISDVGFPSNKVVVVPNSIDFAEAPNGGGTPKSPAAGAEAPVVLTVGRFSYQKNCEMFVRVAAAVARQRADARFVMLGAGFASPLERDVRRLVSQANLGDRLQILPWTSKAESLEAISHASVFVLTSRFEGMPNTLLEALMLKTPAVVTDVDGSRDVLRDGGGYVVGLDDDEAMASHIVGLLNDPRAAKAMAEIGYDRARRTFDIQRNIKTLGDVYQRIVRAD